MAAGMVKRVLLAAPRGYCAGVERAVETVERALEQNGAPVYVRKQIVHNTIVLVGHAGHEEVEGTIGEAPERTVLVERVEDVADLAVPDPERVAYVTQTTLSVDETNEIVSALRERFPALHGPAKEDICYATTNRQRAVKALLPHVDVLLVIGSDNSSNSKRLVEVAR